MNFKGRKTSSRNLGHSSKSRCHRTESLLFLDRFQKNNPIINCQNIGDN